jgi:dihydroxyacetone kinase phosphoprotein-dependent L subunit
MKMEFLDCESTRRMLLYIADRVIENKGILTQIDSAIGDGDHGIGMAIGMERLQKELENAECLLNPYQVFSVAGKAMITSMGGASGVIFGSLYMGGAKNQSADTIYPTDFATMFERSLQVIQQRGGASLGDKTMVDALAPAVEVMKSRADEGFLAMLSAAELAAQQGVEKTKDYRAKHGRAKSLGERAVGYQDAGATSVWIIIRSMREFVESLQKSHS